MKVKERITISEINNNLDPTVGLYRIGYMQDGIMHNVEPGLESEASSNPVNGLITYPARTKEEAARLDLEYFAGRLPSTMPEVDRFVELFGYYPDPLG